MQPQEPQYQQPAAPQPAMQPGTLGVPPTPPAQNGPTTYVVTQPQQSFAVTPEKKSSLTIVIYIVLGLVLASSAGLLITVIILM